jgi:hypothetical protein
MIMAKRKGKIIFKRETNKTMINIPINYNLKVMNKAINSLLRFFVLTFLYHLKLFVSFVRNIDVVNFMAEGASI